MVFCRHCGARLSEHARFCPECGAVQQRLAAADGATPASHASSASDMVMHDVVAPAAAGEVVLSSWEGPGNAADDGAGRASSAEAPSQQGGRHASGGRVAPSRPRRRLLPRIIGALVGLALLAAFALYVVPLFIPHPHDPHEDMALTSETAPSLVGPGDPTGEAVDTPSADVTPGDDEPGGKDSAGEGAAGSSTGQNGSSDAGFSTSEWPTLSDFQWLTGEAAMGNAPDGATRLADLGAVTGGWKAYLYDADMERLLHVTIDVGQTDVTVALDWYYLREGGTGEGREDSSPTSFFSGTWDAGLLDATGSGRVTLAAFWQQGEHQYATGSLVWPDGTVGTIALVRP